MIYRKDTTVSTNLDARAGVPGDVYVAEFQTAGRGRLDHAWQSEKAMNLTFSMVLAAEGLSPAEVATLPLVVGLAVASEVKGALLKWPNDVLVDGRKVCGILCERAGAHVIAGVGVNVNQTIFPPAIADRATSLALLTGHALDREEVLRRLVASISAHHAHWRTAGFAALQPAFARVDDLKGRMVSVRATDDDAAPITGRCGGIQPDGSLLVGSTRVYAGEAHVCAVRG